MADTVFEWNVANMERHTSDGAIFTVHYTIAASNGIYSSSAYGSVGLEQPDPATMIPYADLTKEVVLGWVQDKLGGPEKITEIENALQAQIDEQQAPTKAAGVPWA
jgi:hypothetical protein